MNSVYSTSLKKKLCEDICFNHTSTINTARQYNIPKDVPSSDFKLAKDISSDDDYNNLSNDDLKKLLMKKDIEIARLKKGYLVKGGGMGKKVFITFSKKNTK